MTTGYLLRAFLTVTVLSASLLAKPADVIAHAKNYVFSQEYRTLPKGTYELESHTTLKVPDRHRSNVNTWNFQQELEYGVTDHFNIATYQVWERQNKRNDDDTTKYAGFFFEGKYRIGERGKYLLDPLLYFEYKYDPRTRHTGASQTIESKIVLSKDLGKWNIVYNQVMDSKLGHKGRTDHKFTSGVSYEVFDSFRLGMEAKGDYWRAGSNKNRLAMGPVFSYEHSLFWLACGLAVGVNHHADDYETKLSVGVPF